MDAVLFYDATKMLTRHEGCIPHAYEDSLGYLSIGVGRLIDKRKGGGLSQDEMEYLLRKDIFRCELGLNHHLPWWVTLSHNRKLVLLSMCFNLGIHGLLKFRKTLAACEAGKFREASEMMLKSKWAKQVGNRAVELSDMMRVG